MGHIVKRSHRKHKTQKSESEEYDSLGSDTESGSGDHIRSRLDQSMHLDDHEPASFLSEYTSNAAVLRFKHDFHRLFFSINF